MNNHQWKWPLQLLFRRANVEIYFPLHSTLLHFSSLLLKTLKSGVLLPPQCKFFICRYKLTYNYLDSWPIGVRSGRSLRQYLLLPFQMRVSESRFQVPWPNSVSSIGWPSELIQNKRVILKLGREGMWQALLFDPDAARIIVCFSLASAVRRVVIRGQMIKWLSRKRSVAALLLTACQRFVSSPI